MTAQIAVMNKTAIALASDSAVSIRNQRNTKVYDTASKMFVLSKHHPVAVMCYGSAEFMGVPWETIIKSCRRQLARQSFGSLDDYVKYILDYIQKADFLRPSESQEKAILRSVATSVYVAMRDGLNKEVAAKFTSGVKPTVEELTTLASDRFSRDLKEIQNVPYLTGLDDAWAASLIESFDQDLTGAIQQVFQSLPIPVPAVTTLKAVPIHILCRANNNVPDSGIVVAGFGENDIFPRLRSTLFRVIIRGRIHYRTAAQYDISVEQAAGIVPFAQQEMVNLFMEGIHPEFGRFLTSYLNRLFRDLPQHILQRLGEGLDATKAAKVRGELQIMARGLFEDFGKCQSEFIGRKHVAPVIDTVAVLPKDELAMMAEALVNITSFRRKMTMDAETVGGPIDVAVISKGDGFVWIKRKHYFDASLNPQFLARYTRED